MCTPQSIVTCSKCGEIYNTEVFEFCPNVVQLKTLNLLMNCECSG
ncbi:hypothetical protein [Methanobacterium sp. SMA-27]|nr:hypothetical protein [Methanobacterium sp. SMA-27]